MATSSAMKSSLVLVLLLSAVVASHAAHEVSCKNSCKDPIWLNGILVLAGKTVILELESALEIVCEVIDLNGEKHTAAYKCPEDVTELEFLYDTVTGFLVVKVIAVLDLVGGLLGTVLGALFPLIKCLLRV